MNKTHEHGVQSTPYIVLILYMTHEQDEYYAPLFSDILGTHKLCVSKCDVTFELYRTCNYRKNYALRDL